MSTFNQALKEPSISEQIKPTEISLLAGLQNEEKTQVAVKTSAQNEDLLEFERGESSDQPQDAILLGAAKVEATLLVWSKTAVYFTFLWIWVCFFLLNLQSSIASNIMYYAYADFAAAPQINTAFILSSIIGGVLQLPIGRALTIWGRAEGFLVVLSVYVLGLIVSAACTGPDSFAAGYVLYSVGYQSLGFILSVFVADASGLRNRGLAYAFVGTPTLCTAFTGPLAAQSFIKMSSWRWAYGTFAIVQTVTFIPLAVLFKHFEKKAKKEGILNEVDKGRTTLQSIVHYFHDFDIVGAFVLSSAFILLLLPFSLKTYGRTEYKSVTFIIMVVLGGLLIPVFGIWEKYFARTHFIKWQLFRDRTVLGSCVLAACIFFNFYCWDAQYYNFVIVVYNLSVSMAGYMAQIYTVGSVIWSVLFGLYIRQVNRFKKACLYFGLPLMMLGAGLMVRFRGQESNIGYIIMCQIFLAFSGGTLIIGNEVAGLCAADIGEIPMILSLLGLWSNIGGAIGSAVAAAIYTNTFPSTLYKNLPESAKPNATEIYLGGYTTQMLYPVGSDERKAINQAWGQTQKNSCIAALCVMVLAFPAIASWKNYNVKLTHHKGIVL